MIYFTSSEDSARYALGTEGDNTLVVFGINPSTATDSEFDQTIRSIRGYSTAQGFDSWLVCNLYPQRATDPQHLDKEPNIGWHQENLRIITKVLSQMHSHALCAAWGRLITLRPYLWQYLHDILQITGTKDWHCITTIDGGHPKHPLYASHASQLQPFDMEQYIAKQLS